MATGYTRQSTADIQPNLPINSGDLNAEFDQLQSAFDNTTGHDHTGSSTGTGAQISLTDAVTGILPVDNGGTGLATLTAYSLYIGDTTDPMIAVGTGTANQLLQSNGSAAAPTFVSGITVTNVTASGTVNVTGNITGAVISGSSLSSSGAVTATGLGTFGNINTGGTINATGTITAAGLVLGTDLPLTEGGTGASTQANAFANIAVVSSSIAADGYIRLPNGLILQWGDVSFSGVNTVSVSFGLAFPANIFSIQLTIAQAAGGTVSVGVGSPTLSGFSFNASASITTTGYWFAVGN